MRRLREKGKTRPLLAGRIWRILKEAKDFRQIEVRLAQDQRGSWGQRCGRWMSG